jgi:hypothetical protein
MPTWVKGNHAWITSSKRFDLLGGTNEYVFIGFEPRTPETFWTIPQPGRLQGYNVYVGQNSGDDTTIKLSRKIYNEDTNGYGGEIKTDLLVIPAGETGYFCMDPSSVSIASRTWARNDKLRISMERPTSSNSITNLTLGIMIEIIEEYLFDNDYPPNL